MQVYTRLHGFNFNFREFSGEGLSSPSPLPRPSPPIYLGLRPRFGLGPQFSGASIAPSIRAPRSIRPRSRNCDLVASFGNPSPQSLPLADRYHYFQASRPEMVRHWPLIIVTIGKRLVNDVGPVTIWNEVQRYWLWPWANVTLPYKCQPYANLCQYWTNAIAPNHPIYGMVWGQSLNYYLTKLTFFIITGSSFILFFSIIIITMKKLNKLKTRTNFFKHNKLRTRIEFALDPEIVTWLRLLGIPLRNPSLSPTDTITWSTRPTSFLTIRTLRTVCPAVRVPSVLP